MFGSSRYVLTGLIVLASAAVTSGCGGSGSSAVNTRTVTVKEVTHVTPAPAPAPKPPSFESQAKALVTRYYRLVDQGEFRSAWKLFSPTVQEAQGGFYAWLDGYSQTQST